MERTIELLKGKVTVEELKDILSNFESFFPDFDSVVYFYDELDEYALNIQSIREADYHDQIICAVVASASDEDSSIETISDLLTALENFKEQSFNVKCIEVDDDGSEVFRGLASITQQLDLVNRKATYLLCS